MLAQFPPPLGMVVRYLLQELMGSRNQETVEDVLLLEQTRSPHSAQLMCPQSKLS